VNLEEYCERLYDYNEPIKEKEMRTCRATFTIVDDENEKLNRTEVIEMVFSIADDSNMIDAMLDYLADEDEAENKKPSPIITSKH
jgi:hypothetical protein